MSDREIGIQCSCGFRRRATQINADGTWNGREIEGLHWFQIEEEAAADRRSVDDGNEPPVRRHSMTLGLIADMTWPAVTGEEQATGKAFWVGYWQGQAHLRARLKAKFEEVIGPELHEETPGSAPSGAVIMAPMSPGGGGTGGVNEGAASPVMPASTEAASKAGTMAPPPTGARTMLEAALGAAQPPAPTCCNYHRAGCCYDSKEAYEARVAAAHPQEGEQGARPVLKFAPGQTWSSEHVNACVSDFDTRWLQFHDAEMEQLQRKLQEATYLLANCGAHSNSDVAKFLKREPCFACNGSGWDTPPCKVCDARPNAEGEIEHGRGCYVLSADGGGSETAERCPHCVRSDG